MTTQLRTLTQDQGDKRDRDNERRWIKHFLACIKYYETTGKLPADDVESEEGLKIGYWLIRQRHRFKKGTLPNNRIEAFERYLGTKWDPLKERWERNFATYKDYVEKENKQPQKRTVHNGVAIGNWLTNQVRPNKDKLSHEQIQRLDALGFNWSKRRRVSLSIRKTQAEVWREFYVLCREFIKSSNNLPSQTAYYKGKYIGVWFDLQFKCYNRAQLSEHQMGLMHHLIKLPTLRGHSI